MENGKADAKGDKKSSSAGKIFIGGLSWETTTEKLTKHFEKYGEIIDSVVMRDRNTRQPRGFGFVTYADPTVVDKVMKDSHLIDGRTVEIKRSVPRESMVKGPKTKKVFVGGIPISLSDDDLKKRFAEFGTVVAYQIMREHGSGRSRGFGFVTFDSEDTVDELMSQGQTIDLGGKKVEIKKAEPKESMQEPEPRYERPFGRPGPGFGPGPGPGPYGGFNDDFGRGGYGSPYDFKSGSYGDRMFGGGFSSGFGSGSLGGFGGFGSSYGGYGGSIMSRYDEPDTYGGMSYGGYTGYGSGSSFGGGGYGPVGGLGGYGRSSGRYHPYGRN